MSSQTILDLILAGTAMGSVLLIIGLLAKKKISEYEAIALGVASAVGLLVAIFIGHGAINAGQRFNGSLPDWFTQYTK